MSDEETHMRVIHHLNGTCKSIVAALIALDLPEELENDDELTDAIDAELFCCSICEWWCEHSEANELTHGEFCCDDCNQDNN